MDGKVIKPEEEPASELHRLLVELVDHLERKDLTTPRRYDSSPPSWRDGLPHDLLWRVEKAVRTCPR